MENILPPPIIVGLCRGGNDITIHTARVILLNYVYYTKGVYAPEFITAHITNIPNFEKNITIACNYFSN